MPPVAFPAGVAVAVEIVAAAVVAFEPGAAQEQPGPLGKDGID